MRINLSTLYAGPRGSYGPGICDVPADIAQELIEAGVAIPVKMETRVKPHSEETPRTTRGRGRSASKAEPKDDEPSEEEGASGEEEAKG
jgi:hypothetical protein